MEAKELMIGDWVYNNVADITFQVYPQFFSQWHNKPEQFNAVIQPIPLTPEILEKNGWKHEFYKKDYMVKYDLAVEGKNCWMMWAVKEHNLDIQRQDEKLDVYNLRVQRVCMPCDFVHQLQHALRLCGIDKEITI